MSASPVNTAAIQQWINEKLDTQRVKEKLTAMGFDEETASLHLKEFKKIKYGKRQVAGFIYLAIGSVLGFISCLLTVFNPVPELYYWILFGLTSIAIVIAFLGLYYLLE